MRGPPRVQMEKHRFRAVLFVSFWGEVVNREQERIANMILSRKGDTHVTMVDAVSDHCHYCGDIRVYGDCFGSGGYREILVHCFFDLVRPVAYLWEAK